MLNSPVAGTAGEFLFLGRFESLERVGRPGFAVVGVRFELVGVEPLSGELADSYMYKHDRHCHDEV